MPAPSRICTAPISPSSPISPCLVAVVVIAFVVAPAVVLMIKMRRRGRSCRAAAARCQSNMNVASTSKLDPRALRPSSLTATATPRPWALRPSPRSAGWTHADSLWQLLWHIINCTMSQIQVVQVIGNQIHELISAVHCANLKVLRLARSAV